MKKLLNQKVIAAIIALLLALGIIDTTLVEESHIMPVVESVIDSVSELAGN